MTIHDRHTSTIQNHAGRLGEQARSSFKNAKVLRSSWELILKRRNFLAAIGAGAAIWPLSLSAQQAAPRPLQHA
jgi:hypothetical protein